MNKREWEERVAALKKELADLEANPPKRELGERWKPEVGERYSFVRKDGFISQDVWLNAGIDNEMLNYCNVFETEEEADFQAERTQVMRELDLYATDYNPSMGKDSYSISFSFELNTVCPCPNFSFIKSHTFESEEIAKKAIDDIGEERLKKYYFRVVDSMKYWVNVYHLGGVSIDNEPCATDYCEECGGCDTNYGFETLEEACLFILEEYGERSLKRCGYKISRFEVEEIDENEVD